MKTFKISTIVLVAIFTMSYAATTFGAVSPEEAAKLGTTLTAVGAETAGNKEGTIPAYTGGLRTPPANFKPGSGIRPDPFAGEKPLFSINAKNMSEYADKLTEGAKELFKKFPSTYRMDVYKTHRSAAFPDYVLENTKKNALTARTDYKGLVVRGAGAGYPFPIPKDAHEMMWNHQLRFRGRSTELFVTGVVVDRAGQVSVGNEMEQWVEFPYYDQDRTRPDAEVYWKMKYYLHGPAARVGEAFLIIDDMNVIEKPRIVYLYLPGQRRVRLAPEVAFDTPQPVSNGNMTYDDDQMFNGSMERYDWKIVGKKEVIIPYNCYKLVYECKQDQMLGKQHLNPDLVRWELHRMWIVEATLKQGKRHIVPKRRLYLDEDTWFALATDQYDAHGNFFKAGFIFFTQSYDATVPNGEFNIYYNFISGRYNTTYWPGIKGGYYRYVKTRPLDFWTPGTLAATGLR